VVSYHVFLSLYILHTLHPAFEDGTDRGFRNVGKPQSDAGEIPKRIHKIFKTRRKFEIKNTLHYITLHYITLHYITLHYSVYNPLFRSHSQSIQYQTDSAYFLFFPLLLNTETTV